MKANDLVIFSGDASRLLAQEICLNLEVALGLATVTIFSDGETQVDIQQSVRGKDVFVIQSTCPPVNQHLMELLVMIDALKRASATRITAVTPYFGYARQDRKVSPRAPITAKLAADLITTAGADRVLTLELHAGQIQGFFNIPVDHLFALPAIAPYLQNHYQVNANFFVVVSPDAGGVERARILAKRLGVGLAIADKRREGPNQSPFINIIGEVAGLEAIIFDDIVDTAGTLIETAQAVNRREADNVFACCIHPVLSGEAIEKIEQSEIKEIIVTDTIPLPERARVSSKFKVVSMAKLLADAIKRINQEESVSAMFI